MAFPTNDENPGSAVPVPLVPPKQAFRRYTSLYLRLTHPLKKSPLNKGDGDKSSEVMTMLEKKQTKKTAVPGNF